MKCCEICRGSRVIRLPRYKPVSATVLTDEAPTPVECSYKEYPCPECGTKANVERVFALDAHAMVGGDVPKAAMSLVRESVAHSLVHDLLSKGYIEFEERRFNGPLYPDGKSVVGTLWAVHPGGARLSIESRIRERQDQVAKVAAQEAIRQIQNWGSASRYVDGRIEKARAADLIREAVRSVSENWSKEAQLRAEGKINVEA